MIGQVFIACAGLPQVSLLSVHVACESARLTMDSLNVPVYRHLDRVAVAWPPIPRHHLHPVRPG